MLTIIVIFLSMHASILTNITISLSFVLVSLWRIGHQQRFLRRGKLIYHMV
jgi:hypothetical protein